MSEEVRRRFLVCRGRLRQILSFYLSSAGAKVSPSEMTFQYQALGKPSLYGFDLRFSVSHSADLALMAFSPSWDVGIDLERVREDVGAERIVSRFFSQDQRKEFEETPQEKRLESFFRIWTRREACLKARGLGVGGAEGHEDEGLQVQEWSPFPGFQAALAWNRKKMALVNYQFDNINK